ncbi:MAG: trypsin-like peptidase domain-containing protein [Deltaproteobacteria bacterium]|nr:trypsin-like peptidase domain-containing protein [Deltaproteobacteria bacterium]
MRYVLPSVAILSAAIGLALIISPLMVNEPEVVKIYAYWDNEEMGMGTGFICGDKMVMTAAHVLNIGNNFRVEYADGETEWITGGAVSFFDIGILPVSRKGSVNWDLHYEAGDTVYTKGFPYNNPVLWTSKGIISSLEFKALPFWMSVIGVDADAAPGNSGGPLVNEKGQVVGMVVGGNGNIVLCVPASRLKEFADTYREICTEIENEKDISTSNDQEARQALVGNN